MTPSPPPGGISIDGWKTLWKYCAEGVYSSDDDYKYGFQPLNKGDVQVSTFYASSLYGNIDAAADSSEHPLLGALEPENWNLVEIDDGTYYIAEYLGILDKEGRSAEETEAVMAFCRVVRLRRRAGCLGRGVLTPIPATPLPPAILYPDGVPSIYTIKNFALTAVEGHRHELCRVCCRPLQRVDQHHDQPGLLLGRPERRSCRARLGEPGLGHPDPGCRLIKK